MPDGEEQTYKPVNQFTGIVIAIVHINDDIRFTFPEIKEKIYF